MYVLDCTQLLTTPAVRGADSGECTMGFLEAKKPGSKEGQCAYKVGWRLRG